MKKHIKREIDLREEKLHQMVLLAAMCVSPKTTLKQVIKEMQEKCRGSVLVEEKGDLVGIFTERDILTRILGKDIDDQKPIKEFMTKNPFTLKITDTLEDAVVLMVEKGIRHVPILDQFEGNDKVISVRDVIDYLAERFPTEVLNLPPDFNQTPKKEEGG